MFYFRVVFTIAIKSLSDSSAPTYINFDLFVLTNCNLMENNFRFKCILHVPLFHSENFVKKFLKPTEICKNITKHFFLSLPVM